MRESLERILERKRRVVSVAAGREMADVVLKNASYLNVFSGRVCKGDIAVAEGVIASVEYDGRGEQELDLAGRLLLPGFIDAHIHLESSMVSPAKFARAALPHGTTTVVTDPHEIANVMGADGIELMLQATEGLPLDVRFMLPSCVPASGADESGAALGWRDIEPFYSHPRVLGLAEVMDYAAVASADGSVLAKIAAAELRGRRVDGHAPGLAGRALNAYAAAGISSDHECSEIEDALRKLELGQFIMLREGTAAKNLGALLPLLNTRHAERCMFCCDDRHPSELVEDGHIDCLVRRAVLAGVEPASAVRAASLNAARYFMLNDRGAIAPGYLADMLVTDGFEELNIEMVFSRGRLMYAGGKLRDFAAPRVEPALMRRALESFHLPRFSAGDFALSGSAGVIELVPGEIVTAHGGFAEGVDLKRDILRAAVVERHKNTGHIGLGYVRGYGLREGAVATSVSHDSHNIIAVGADERSMACAVNRVAENCGGFVVWRDGCCAAELPLPIAGLMSPESLRHVRAALDEARRAAFRQGVNPGIDPFMTLGFMALPVIPALRLTTRGVFDVAGGRYLRPDGTSGAK